MSATISRLMWFAALCTFALAALSLIHIASLEFGPLRDHAIQVDELYFASCSVRGLATGEIPIAGCHDNKAPLIFLVHQLLQFGAPPYSLFAIKMAAFGVVVLLTALVARLAHRLAGAMAAVIAASLVLSTFASDAALLALKTETVGAFFMLLGLGLLLRADRYPWCWWATGLLFGLAIATKQTFAFAAIAVAVWGWFVTTGDSRALRLRNYLWNMARFGVALVMPLLSFFVIFFLQDRHEEYLASLFLYPSLYNPSTQYSWLKRLAWRIAEVLDWLGKTPLLCGLFLAAIAGVVHELACDRARDASALNERLLLVVMASGMLLVTLVSPNSFNYHVIPAWTLMAILGGVVVGEVANTAGDATPRATPLLAAGLVAFALMMSATSWISNGARGRMLVLERPAAVLDDAGGQFAYVLGTWPQFYVYNDLVPASGILFPWAFPGVPAYWAYAPPEATSMRGRLLRSMHEANSGQLLEDFRRTPPKYIVVSHAMAREGDSPNVIDVPGFDEYLQANCVFARALPEYLSSAQSLYRCDGAEDLSTSEGSDGK